MNQCTVTSLTIYPFKGSTGISVPEIEVRRGGIVGDRVLMPVKDGVSYQQKNHPRLATIKIEQLAPGQLKFSHPDAGEFIHQVQTAGDVGITRHIHENLQTIDQGDEIARWVCAAMKDDGIRVVSSHKPWEKWKGQLPEREKEFARIHSKPQAQLYDMTAVMVESEDSLEDLNRRLAEPVGMDRFRPSVVIKGLKPYDEELLECLSGPEVDLLYVTLCERCALTTTDQTTGLRPTNEPLRTLSTYRRRTTGKYASGVVFGTYFAVGREGRIRVGDVMQATMQSEVALHSA